MGAVPTPISSTPRSCFNPNRRRTARCNWSASSILALQAAWRAAGNEAAPVINGRSWTHMADDAGTPGDEAHGFMPHFDQHVWLFRDNPAGTLEPFNPAVTCDHHAG